MPDLFDAIEAFIDGWNEHPTPLIRAKDPDELLDKIEDSKAPLFTIH